ncbi:MAG: type I-U CRISPR-associated protein Cas8c [Deltaproteobacteria bacterium]|nr:type I-U CRISPR-associated protein Cas8c [Deltaproteobacteria bacterium]
MAKANIPVDLLNPGQVFACLGIMELADTLCSDENHRGNTKAGFDWSEPRHVRFVVEVEGEKNPLDAVLDFLRDAQVKILAVEGSEHKEQKWKGELLPLDFVARDGGYPFPLPEKSAKLVAQLVHGANQSQLTYWGDGNIPLHLTCKRDDVKFWAGAGGFPGAALLRDALSSARPFIDSARADPFALSVPMPSSFRFDWRRDYVPLDAGFSLNNHGAGIQPGGFPLVEILAAIGLTHARPKRVTKFEYRYGVLGCLAPMNFLRPALGLSALPFATRTFTMQLKSPGKDDRCITTVQEDKAND